MVAGITRKAMVGLVGTASMSHTRALQCAAASLSTTRPVAAVIIATWLRNLRSRAHPVGSNHAVQNLASTRLCVDQDTQVEATFNVHHCIACSVKNSQALAPHLRSEAAGAQHKQQQNRGQRPHSAEVPPGAELYVALNGCLSRWLVPMRTAVKTLAMCLPQTCLPQTYGTGSCV
jgi:hypothetical protein